MAIGLEFDFRSNPAAGASDGNIRQGASREQGGEFAAVLSRTKTTESEDAAQAGSGTPAFAVPVLPDMLIPAPEEPPAPDAVPEVIGTLTEAEAVAAAQDASVPGELEIDRALEQRREFEDIQGLPAVPSPSRLHASVQAKASEDAGEVAEAVSNPVQPPVPQAGTPADTAVRESPASAAPSPEADSVAAPADPAAAAQQVALPGAKAAPEKDLDTAPNAGATPPEAAPAVAAEGASDAASSENGKDDSSDREQARPEPTMLAAAATAVGERAVPVESSSPSAPAALPAAAPVAASATPAPLPLAPAHAMVTAAPAEVVDIVSKSAEDGQSDRVVIQLDPPELGRVSIDFRFEAGGLQHVTVTGETPEAMRQLRAMHHELVQALEKQGLDAQSMTFQQQHQNPQQQTSAAMLRQLQAGRALMAETPAAGTSAPLPPQPVKANGRLDMRL
jgi:flagellar hook-length control protein FliK